MAVNQYFQQPTTTEKNIVIDQVAELIQISGRDVFYIPRKLNRLDELFGEDVLSSFTVKHEIEMYINDVTEYGGDGDLMAKFGLEMRDELTLTVSSKRFLEETKMTIPREGDLVYIPFRNALFEIKYVDFDKKLFAHDTTPKYDLNCELFEYSHEEIEVGISEIDGLDGVDMIEDENGDLQPHQISLSENNAINDALLGTYGDPYNEQIIPEDDNDDSNDLFDPSNPFG